MAPKKIVLAFDAYGTLLSTESTAKQLASHFGEEKAKTIAATWRKYQLEYTWRANSMGIYLDFSSFTRRSLSHALAESGVELNEEANDALLESYDSLSCYPDVKPMLEKLKDTKDIKRVIFSNGTYIDRQKGVFKPRGGHMESQIGTETPFCPLPFVFEAFANPFARLFVGTHKMVSSSVQNSPDLSPYARLFDEIVSVEDVRKFKPAPETYHHLAQKVGKDANNKEQMGEIYLVSGNPFDVVGGRAVGMNSIWVDRAGNGWQDAMMPGKWDSPTEIVSSLEQVVDVAVRAAGQGT